ncbi:MAG: carbohydrate kinase family protein [Selenomonadaceae bacterium]|nr:carbohydrate kinase family protein [Selenomonadaceae bacterium]
MSMVVIGTIFVDVKGFPADVYIPGGRNAGRIEEVHGGVSRNVAENIAKCGFNPTFLSLVDGSGAAKAVMSRLDKVGVDTKYIKTTSNGMGTWLAIFDHTGEVVASLSKRPDFMPLAEVIRQQGDEIFGGCDSILLEIDIEEAVVAETFKYARKYNKKVYALISNMTIALERMEYIKECECFVCNQQEAGIFFDANLESAEPTEMAAILSEKVKAAGMKSMIVTMADKGAAYADSKGNHGVCSAEKVNVVDTTGAGDAFFSGMAMGLTCGKTMAESCVIGTKIAAAVICTTENTCPQFTKAELGLE